MKYARILHLIIAAVIVLSSCAAHGAALKCLELHRWQPPNVMTGSVQLPRLQDAPVLDGNIAEWQDAFSIPVRCENNTTALIEPHAWKGPSDLGMEFYAGWCSSGLCIAAVVADSELVNTRPGPDYWQQDSIEIFVDGRSGDQFANPPYTPGCYQLLVRPPFDDQPPHVYAKPGETIAGLKTAGKQTDCGYTFEMIIPWSAFPGFKPESGASFGLHCIANDYDSYTYNHKPGFKPFALTPYAAEGLFNSPQNFIRYHLVESPSRGADIFLGPAAAIDIPDQHASAQALNITIESGANISAQVDSIEVSVTDPDGEAVLNRTLEPYASPSPFKSAKRASIRWDTSGLLDGFYTVNAVLKDSQGAPLGRSSRAVMLTGDTERQMAALFADADIAGMSQSEPFKAYAYLGLAACVERFKRKVKLNEVWGIQTAVSELDARIQALNGAPISDASPLLNLVGLTAIPESQVIVEYPYPGQAAVAFHCGQMPIAKVMIYDRGTPEQAARSVVPNKGWLTRDYSHDLTAAGNAAYSCNSTNRIVPYSWTHYRPESQVLLVAPGSKRAYALSLSQIDHAQADAVCLSGICTDAVRRSVEIWAKKNNVALLPWDEAKAKRRVLYAGRVDTSGVQEIASFGIQALTVQEWFHSVNTSIGRLQAICYAPSDAAAVCALELVAAGKPVTTEQVDKLRQMVVDALSDTQSDTQPEPFIGCERDLYMGDVHMHTIYSDGSCTAAGLMFQAMYNFMDYAVMTDHNTIDGALVAQKLLDHAGVDFRCIVGEEITTNWSHFNAYPLTSLIDWNISAYEMAKDAHAQGAVIQWNHPEAVNSDWTEDHLHGGFMATSLDAWEHVPVDYAEWKQNGMLPLVTGSTDTHSFAFSGTERTLIYSPTADQYDLVEAIRSRHATALVLSAEDMFIGDDNITAHIRAALRDGDSLRRAKAARIAAVLKRADIPALLLSSPAEPLTADEIELVR